MPKGGDYEREVCKRLSRWWSKGLGGSERDDVFWRTSTSGARATSRRKKGQDTAGQYGDICATDPIGLPFLKCFAVEIKRGYNSKLCLLDCMDHDDKSAMPMLEDWYDQAANSKAEAGAKSFLIIFKRDRRSEMVATDFNGWGMRGVTATSYSTPYNHGSVSWRRKDEGWYHLELTPLADFLKEFHPKRLVRLARKMR